VTCITSGATKLEKRAGAIEEYRNDHAKLLD